METSASFEARSAPSPYPTFPTLPIFAALRILTGNPLVAYNATLLVTFPLSAISMLVLVFYLTRRFSAALIAGFIYGFTPIRLSHLHHVQLESMMWLPLLILFFHRWLESRRWRDAILVGLLFAIQYLTTVYTALYLIPVLLVWSALHFIFKREFPESRCMAQAVAAAAVALGILMPFVLKYQQLRDWNVQPPESLKIFFSSDLWWNLLATFPSNLLYGRLFHAFSSPPYERFYFTGLAVLILASSSLWRWRDRTVKLFVATALVSFVFALGPFLQVSGHVTAVPLPYHWIFDALPGFSMLRVPARSGLITLTAVTVLCAFGWLALVEKVRLSEGKCAAFTLLVLSLEFFSAPIPLLAEVSGDRIPKAYEYLRTSAESGGVLELPTHAQVSEASGFTDRVYTYFSTYHFRPIVVGYSGYFPPTFEPLIAETKNLPSDTALDVFEAIGVRWIVLHTRYLDATQRQDWDAAIAAGKRLAKVAEYDDGSEVISLKPVLRISQDLNQLAWSLAKGSIHPDGMLPITLRSDGIRGSNFDYVVNPQLPRVSATLMQVAWRDAANRVVSQEVVKVRLPYLLNHASIGTEVKVPRTAGQYSLELQVLEPPLLRLSAAISIP